MRQPMLVCAGVIGAVVLARHCVRTCRKIGCDRLAPRRPDLA
jgi:hypothetical protein